MGYVSFSAARRRFEQAGATELCNLYVLRSHQGLGVGRALVDAVRGHIDERDLVLTVFAGNKRTQGFYQHVCFRLTGRVFHDDETGDELEMLLAQSPARA